MMKLFKRNRVPQTKAQLELGVNRAIEPDRNFDRGGRSFYFFDFDDNIAVLTTPTIIFNKATGREVMLSSKEFAEHSAQIGKAGVYRDYEIRMNDSDGTFRHFRDREFNLLEKVLGRRQLFVQDFQRALEMPDFHWKGPSWECFYHAVFNRRPVSLITARGHNPETMKAGIRLLVREGHIPYEPNYLSLYPVNHPPVRLSFSQGGAVTVAQMKQAAIRASVEEAIRQYGNSPHHRFGMSDDDPHNVALILEEMTRLKQRYPQMSFFVFDTHKGQFFKHEVFEDHTKEQPITRQDQLRLF